MPLRILPSRRAALFGGGATAQAAHIIGIAITPGAKTHTRVDAAGNTLTGTQYNLGGSYYSTHGAFGLSDVTIDGQAMVRVPAMYYKRGTIVGGANNGLEAWWVADKPVAGFTLHPAFYSAGVAVPEFWVGKYQGSNDGGTKVASLPGVLPLVSINIGQFQTRCAARNTGGVTGFMLWSIYQLAVIQMLAMIETGSTDSQAAIGNGRVSQSSAANVDAADVAQATYRGIVGLWGNVWEFLDGWETISGVQNLWDRLGNKGWVSTGVSRNTTAANGVLAMLSTNGAGYDFRDVFVLDTAAASEAAATWPDYRYFLNSGSYILISGGDWTDGSRAGLWALYGYIGPAISSTNFGGRLAKV